jgi:hypothetical protein
LEYGGDRRQAHQQRNDANNKTGDIHDESPCGSMA